MFFNKLLVDGFLPPNRQTGSFISPSFGMSQYSIINNIWVATTRKITILWSIPLPRLPAKETRLFNDSPRVKPRQKKRVFFWKSTIVNFVRPSLDQGAVAWRWSPSVQLQKAIEFEVPRGCRPILRWFATLKTMTWSMSHPGLVGGFNPFYKDESIWIISPCRDEH